MGVLYPFYEFFQKGIESHCCHVPTPVPLCVLPLLPRAHSSCSLRTQDQTTTAIHQLFGPPPPVHVFMKEPFLIKRAQYSDFGRTLVSRKGSRIANSGNYLEYSVLIHLYFVP